MYNRIWSQFSKRKDTIMPVTMTEEDFRKDFFFDDEIAWTADGEYVNGGTHTVIENVNKAINIYR